MSLNLKSVIMVGSYIVLMNLTGISIDHIIPLVKEAIMLSNGSKDFQYIIVQLGFSVYSINYYLL